VNTIAIAAGVKINNRYTGIATTIRWPKVSTIKAIARYELNEIKRKARTIIDTVAKAYTLPAAALA
jgi:hypothetical protein